MKTKREGLKKEVKEHFKLSYTTAKSKEKVFLIVATCIKKISDKEFNRVCTVRVLVNQKQIYINSDNDFCSYLLSNKRAELLKLANREPSSSDLIQHIQDVEAEWVIDREYALDSD